MRKIDSVKKHIKDYRVVYITGVAGVVVGSVGVLAFGNSDVAQKVSQNAILIWRPETTQVVVNFVEKSTPSKPVHLEGTNLFFDSLSEASRVTGHSLSLISKNVNGHIPNVKGDVFKLLEVAG